MAYGIVHQFAGGTEDQYRASIAAVHPSDGATGTNSPRPSARRFGAADTALRLRRWLTQRSG